MSRCCLLPLLVILLAVGQVRSQALRDAIALQFTNPDSAIAIANVLEKARESGDTLRSNAFEVVGIAQMVKGDLRAAFKAHQEALELRQRLQWHSGIGHSFNNLGLVSSKMGDMATAMEFYLKGLSVAEIHGDNDLLTRFYGNIGTIYEQQQDFTRALYYYRRSLSILEKGVPDQVLGNVLNNIALVYSRELHFDTALVFWKRTLDVRKLLQDDRGKALALNNMGSLVYVVQSQFESADSVYAIALPIYQKLNDKVGMAMVLGSMGNSALLQGQSDKAVLHCSSSIRYAKEIHNIEYEVSACKCLADAFALQGDHREANRLLKRYVFLTDSINASESSRKAALLEQRYGYEKEQMRVALERERERTIAEEEIKRQHLLRNMSVALGMMGILLFFIQFNNYRKKQQANELLHEKNVEISHQKEQIAEKSKEITDSIQYAKRLQDARLPRNEVFERIFKHWHVLYLPKDIVSGDFYWLEEVDGRIFVAVADCTGHGVPGAMVSMVGIQGLNRAVLELRITSPAAILHFLSDHVEEAFNRGGATVRDGMDIALCVIEADGRSLTYAGAYNPLWQITTLDTPTAATVRESKGELRLLEWKADRRSIGGHLDGIGFSEHVVAIGVNDIFLLSSDGYADQFGGLDNRKFGSARFRQLTLNAAISDNIPLLDKEFSAWKEGHEQIDDVTVVVFTARMRTTG
jgi:serine phosphatase RsbU (regulator of sigma subunit)